MLEAPASLVLTGYGGKPIAVLRCRKMIFEWRSAPIRFGVHGVVTVHCSSQSVWGLSRRVRLPRLMRQSRCRPGYFREFRYERHFRYDVYP